MKPNYFDKLLLDLCKIQSKSKQSQAMEDFLITYCQVKGYEVETDSHRNIYVTKGEADIYPCMVAHTDTVHDIEEGYKVYLGGDKIFGFNILTGNQMGVGGDDKVGLWVTLKLLDKFPEMKAVFFADEEIGCIGSHNADLEFFNNVGFVLQCDRKGNSDFVNNINGSQIFGETFKEAISPTLKKFKYKITNGGSTDVGALRKKLPICMANMSCGYYNPHRDNEYISLKDVWNTYLMCEELFEVLHGKYWLYVPPKYPVSAKCPVHGTNMYTNRNAGPGVFSCWQCRKSYTTKGTGGVDECIDHAEAV